MKHNKWFFTALLLSAGLLTSGCGAGAPQSGGSAASPAESAASGKISVASGTESAASGRESVSSGTEIVSSGTEAVSSGTESGGNVMDKDVQKVLNSLQGRWVDVNGDTVLEISGSRMKYSYRGWSKSYSIAVRATQGNYVLESSEDRGDFEIMSSLEIIGDELRGYEQILDGDSHTYRFVREEKKAELLKIEDLSKDLPKTIESRDIEEFTLVFNYDSYSKYGIEDLQTGSYCWEINKKDADTWAVEFRGMGSSYVITDFREEVGADYVRGLAELLAGEDIAGHNGYYKKNAVNKSGYSLYVTFASGERISIQASGDAGDTCVFDLPKLVGYAKKLGIEQY